MLQRPFDMFDEGAPDQFMIGFMNQVSQAVDDGVTKEVKIMNNNSVLADCFSKIHRSIYYVINYRH